MSRTPKIPTYRLHKATGQAVVTLNGRDVYLGAHGTPDSRARYERLIAEWLAADRHLPPPAAPDLTVTEAAAAYWHHATAYYGAATAQAERVARVLGILRGLYGDTAAARFGPQAFKACRQKMVERGWCRRYVNQCAGCLRRAFKWLAGEGLIPASVWHALQAVEGLKRGRTEAPESEPVRPVAEALVEATLPHVLPPVAAMVRLQLLTAMRPGEVIILRPCDVDRSGDVWAYRPARHKGTHRGLGKVILIGPRAQAVLAPWLLRPAESYCFSPREALGARAQSPRSARAPGHRYQRTSYTHAIAEACRRAGVAHWHPHQLRHSAATKLAAEFGVELARKILGHRQLSTTELYAEMDLRAAAEVVRRIG